MHTVDARVSSDLNCHSMGANIVLVAYCSVSFLTSAVCFLVKWLLLRDAQRNKLSLAARHVQACQIAGWVLLWYGISVSFTIANKWVFVDWRGGFPFPILMTACHMGIKFVLSRITARCTGGPPTPLGPHVFWRCVGIYTRTQCIGFARELVSQADATAKSLRDRVSRQPVFD